MKRKLIVISIDSFVNEDLEYMRQLPAFREIIEASSVVHNVTVTYPSLTHSVHTSILTGCYPERHGVIHNEQFFPFTKSMPWFEEASLCKVKTLPDFAKEAGFSTAYVYWPVTLGAQVDWNLHRGGVHTPVENLIPTLRNRATPGLFDEVWPYAKDTFEEPDYYVSSDAYTCRACEYMIRTYQPDVLYAHIVLIDHARHAGGVHGQHIHKAYDYLDGQLQLILNALKDTGLDEQTILCLTSDHGHLDVERVVSINRFLLDHGLQQADQDGNLLSYDVYCHSCSLSAQIYVRQQDPELARKARDLLWENRRLLGIGAIVDKKECRERYHTDGDYAFMLETDGRTSFSAMPHFPLVTPTDNSDYRTSKASHGHQPERGPQPAFVVRNPFAKRTVSLSHGNVIDQAPTLAALLGFEMSGCDGKPIDALLRLEE